MSFPRYKNYKDSGVDWLGPVPSGWGIKRIKHLFETKKRISGDEGYEVLSITQQGIKVKDIESGDGQLSMDYSKYQFVEVGDFAMNHMDLLTGYVDISSFFGVTSPDYRVFCVRDKEVCFDRYYLYLFQMGYRNKIFYAFGQGSSQLGRWRFPTEQFNSFEFPCPSIQEQKNIASFLDYETTKIDKLIAEQEQLLALLAEKRKAIISNAVTRGLNPVAQMKASGIELLGEVPTHWQVKRLKHVGIAQGGLTYDPSEIVNEGEGTLVLRSSNVQGRKIVFDDNVYVRKEIPKKLITQADDILICSRNGSRALIGKNALIEDNATGLTFGAFMTVFRSELNRYLFWLFNSQLFELQSSSFLTSTINQLTIGNLYSFEIPLPPCEEQQSIITFLENETAKLDAMTTEAQRGIALLQERRVALISAAVTGKIDVRSIAERDAA